MTVIPLFPADLGLQAHFAEGAVKIEARCASSTGKVFGDLIGKADGIKDIAESEGVKAEFFAGCRVKISVS
ncbi:hypothetical protein GCM10022631_10340 [Deinococcus rubellus]